MQIIVLVIQNEEGGMSDLESYSEHCSSELALPQICSEDKLWEKVLWWKNEEQFSFCVAN